MTNFADYIVQEVATSDLLGALDASVDNFYDGGCGCGEDECFYCDLNEWPDQFLYLMQEKLEDCSQTFINSFLTQGQRDPICVRVEYDGTWTLGNGNHRFACAVNFGIPTILVVFSEDSQYMLTEITSPGEDHGDNECGECGYYTCHCDEMYCNVCDEWECGLHAQCPGCGEEYPVDGASCCCQECYSERVDCTC